MWFCVNFTLWPPWCIVARIAKVVLLKIWMGVCPFVLKHRRDADAPCLACAATILSSHAPLALHA
jgi:hypothetical protein